MKLEYYDQNKKKQEKRKALQIVISVFAIILTIVRVSYALFERREEITLINSEVRNPKADEVSYETEYNEEVETVHDAIEDLIEKVGN